MSSSRSIIVSAFLLAASAASAQEKSISEEEAKRIALTKVSGAILEVERETENGLDVFSVEILKDRKKFEVHINPVTGAVISIEGDEKKLDAK